MKNSISKKYTSLCFSYEIWGLFVTFDNQVQFSWYIVQNIGVLSYIVNRIAAFRRKGPPLFVCIFTYLKEGWKYVGNNSFIQYTFEHISLFISCDSGFFFFREENWMIRVLTEYSWSHFAIEKLAKYHSEEKVRSPRM